MPGSAGCSLTAVAIVPETTKHERTGNHHGAAYPHACGEAPESGSVGMAQMRSMRISCVALAAVLAAGGSLAAAGDTTRLIARGWQPYMALAGDAPPRQAIQLLRRELHLNQTVLTATDLAPALQTLADEIWNSLEDFDLNRLYHRLPEVQGGRRSLALAGRLAADRYAVRKIDVPALETPLTEFGQMQALLSLAPNDDPRGTRYSARMRLQANVGPVRWESILEAMRLGLTHIVQPAPVSAPQVMLARTEAMNPDLSPTEQRTLAQLWTAFPASWGWYADFATVTDLVVEDDSTAIRKHLRVMLQLDRNALTSRYPQVAAYLQQLGNFLTARILIENDKGRWLEVIIDSDALSFTIDVWIADGQLAPTRNGRPMLDAIEPGFPDSASWRSVLRLRLNAFGIGVIIDEWQTRWRYHRTPLGAHVAGTIDTTPEVALEGRLLGVLPAGWFEGVLPVSIEGTVHDFMQVLATSNKGDGAQFLMRYDENDRHGSVVKLAADWDGLDNYFVRLCVRIVSGRVLPDEPAADGLRHFFHDALLAFGQDLDRWDAILRQQSSQNQATDQHEGGNNRHRRSEQQLQRRARKPPRQ